MGEVNQAPRDAAVTFLMAYAIPTLGMERAAIRLIEALSKSCRVALVVVHGEAPVIPGVEVRVLCPGPSTALSALIRWARLAAWTRRQSGTVVPVGIWVAIPFLLCIRKKTVRTVVWEHSMVREKVRTARKLGLLARLAAFLYSRADSVVVVSHVLAGDVRQTCGVSPTVIPNLISEPTTDDEGRCGSSDGDSVPGLNLVTVGSLTTTKRQRVIIEALPQLPDDTRLTVVGDGPERQRLERLVDMLKLGERVRFAGHVPGNHIPELMRGADVVVHPAAGETFGLVYFEAAQNGVPVLASRNRVAEEMIPKYVPGVLFDGGAAELAARLLDGSIADAQGLADRARDNRERDFAPSAIIASWRELLRS